jgi:hypothetical protein
VTDHSAAIDVLRICRIGAHFLRRHAGAYQKMEFLPSSSSGYDACLMRRRELFWVKDAPEPQRHTAMLRELWSRRMVVFIIRSPSHDSREMQLVITCSLHGHISITLTTGRLHVSQCIDCAR